MLQTEQHGTVVVITTVEADPAELHADERAAAAALAPVRAREMIAGRVALRRAGAGEGPVLADARGAPILPAGLVGSVSHKGTIAAAVVAPSARGRVGIDIERTRGMRIDISRRILTAGELAALPTDPVARERRVLLTFSIKEAIYKAIDPFPFVQRYVGFQEVALAFTANGEVRVTTAIPVAVEVAFRDLGDHWLATARANPVG